MRMKERERERERGGEYRQYEAYSRHYESVFVPRIENNLQGHVEG
jgi:hypothetical protein